MAGQKLNQVELGLSLVAIIVMCMVGIVLVAWCWYDRYFGAGIGLFSFIGSLIGDAAAAGAGTICPHESCPQVGGLLVRVIYHVFSCIKI